MSRVYLFALMISLHRFCRFFFSDLQHLVTPSKGTFLHIISLFLFIPWVSLISSDFRLIVLIYILMVHLCCSFYTLKSATSTTSSAYNKLFIEMRFKLLYPTTVFKSYYALVFCPSLSQIAVNSSRLSSLSRYN